MWTQVWDIQIFSAALLICKKLKSFHAGMKKHNEINGHNFLCEHKKAHF